MISMDDTNSITSVTPVLKDTGISSFFCNSLKLNITATTYIEYKVVAKVRP
jgi:hypothetical protein